jgi:hypothetical protein
MKCAHLQRHLLAAERPDQIGADGQRHLSGCASCRALQRRLLHIERAIPQVPVPASVRRPSFLGQFLQQTPVDLPAVEPVLLPLVKLRRGPTSLKERGQRKLALAAALVATLAFVAFGMWALRPHQPPAVDYTLNHRTQLEAGLRTATEPTDQVRVVMQVADRVGEDASTLAQAGSVDGPRVAALAKYYHQLLGEDLLKYVDDLPPDSRRTLLKDLEAHLQETDSKFALLAATRGGTKAGESLNEIALAARETSAKLRERRTA